jgi:hypothetical protein
MIYFFFSSTRFYRILLLLPGLRMPTGLSGVTELSPTSFLYAHDRHIPTFTAIPLVSQIT